MYAIYMEAYRKMNILANLAKRVAELEANQSNMIQNGIVVAVHESENLLDIEVRGVTLEKVPYHTERAGGDGKSYWVPEVGESGTLLCAGGQVGNAVFIPGLNTTTNPAPESDVDIFKLDFGNGNEITVDMSETEIKRTGGEIVLDAAGGVKRKVGTNEELLNAIALNLLGALIYPTGQTGFLAPTGPVMFAPTSTPDAVPSPPAGSEPDADGNLTQIPAQKVTGVKINATSNISLVLPAIPVTTTGGAGTTTAGTYNATVTGTIKLEFPARTL